jgi:hypothetical protein
VTGQGARRISAALALAGVVLIVWSIFSPAWWKARVENDVIVVDIKLGLTGVTGCGHDPAGVWRCESVEWKDVGAPPNAGLWVWSGRLLFGLGLAAAIAFGITALIAAVPLDAHLPISPPRVGIAFAIAALLILGLYRLATPDGVKLLLHSGRSWWLCLGGLALGAAGAWRELHPPEPDFEA